MTTPRRNDIALLTPDVSAYLRAITSKGGRAKGHIKRRGNSAYYRRLRKLGIKARKLENEQGK